MYFEQNYPELKENESVHSDTYSIKSLSMHTNPQSLVLIEESSIKEDSPRGSIVSDDEIEEVEFDEEMKEMEKDEVMNHLSKS